MIDLSHKQSILVFDFVSITGPVPNHRKYGKFEQDRSSGRVQIREIVIAKINSLFKGMG